MATCVEISQTVATSLGQPGLVVDFNGADYTPTAKFLGIINDAHRYLDRRFSAKGADGVEAVALVQGAWYLPALARLQNITRIDLLDSAGVILPSGGLLQRTMAWLRDHYLETFADVEEGTPAYWARQAQTQLSGSSTTELDFSSSTEFGSGGTGDGEFNGIGGMFFYEDELYVSDLRNSRIQVFDASGTFVRKWGTIGVGDSNYNFPEGIYVSDGEVFVVDSLNDRVKVTDLDGVFLRSWGTTGAGNGQFNAPLGITVNSNVVYVSEAINPRVQYFSLAGTYQGQWGSEGEGEGEFDTPFGMSCYGDYIYVVDTLSLQKFTLAGVFQWRVDIATNAQGIDASTGVLFVCCLTGEIRVYDTDGVLQETGGTDELSGNYPLAIAYGDENLYVGLPWGIYTTEDKILIYGATETQVFEQARIITMPPADEDYTANVYGSYWAHEMESNTDITWWSDTHPDILRLAIRMQIAMALMRNQTEIDDYKEQIHEALDDLSRGAAIEEQAGPPERRRFGWSQDI